MATRAAFSPQREHLSLAATALIDTGPHDRAISLPVLVLAAPQLLHSIFKLAPNRARSVVDRMCFVHIHRREAGENDS
jgi:hypothetical protein